MQTDNNLTIDTATFIVFTLVNNEYEVSFCNSGMLLDHPDQTLVHGIRANRKFFLANYAKEAWTAPTDQWVTENCPKAFSSLLLLGIPHVPN